MVTTSYFPSTAYDFITRVSKRVVLIDATGARQSDDPASPNSAPAPR